MHDLERFVNGFQRFQQQYFAEKPHLYKELREGQHPGTLLIGCADSRVDPALLLGVDPGDIFTVRNVANLVPPCAAGMNHQGVSSAIQFAVDQLKVARIIVLGHGQCGGIRALLAQSFAQDGETDFIGRWVAIAEPARVQVERALAGASPAARQRACELAAILVSLQNLLTFPWVKAAVDAGHLSLHGWYFDMEQGALLAWSKGADAFLPLVCPIPKTE